MAMGISSGYSHSHSHPNHSLLLPSSDMDSFTAFTAVTFEEITTTKTEEVDAPVNEDGTSGSTSYCVIA